MNNKTKFKIFIFIILLFLDAGLISRFWDYDIANKSVTIIFIILTVWMFLSFFKENQLHTKEQKKLKENVSQAINGLRNGIIPQIENCSLILKKEEFPCLEVHTYLKDIKNKLVGSTGSSGGMSVKVAKGIYLRSGSGESKKIYKNITDRYFGNLIITNQRIVFINSQKGFEILYQNLTGVSSSGKDLIVQSKNKSYVVFADTPDVYVELIRAVVKQYQ